MPNFIPKATNFYSKTGVQPPSGGSQSIQALGAQVNGNKTVTRGIQNSPNGGLRRGQTASPPGLMLQAAADAIAGVSSAAAGITSGLIDSALSGATAGLGLPNLDSVSFLNPTLNRLLNSGIPAGGSYPGYDAYAAGPDNFFTPIAKFAENQENRVIISDQTGLFIGQSPILQPLTATNGVIFPYTPTMSTSHKANYEMESLIHTNYANPYYTYSTVDGIQIQGRFTAQTPKEAKYIIAMMYFFKTATKMFYGASSHRGTPPPVLFLDAHGSFMYDHVPVVIRDFQYSLPNDVNYLSVTVGGQISKVPVDLNITVDMVPTYSRNKISTQFDLAAFSQGQLITKGTGRKAGGWI